MGCISYGWRGVAGILALFFASVVIVSFLRRCHLWTVEGWSDLKAYQVLLWLIILFTSVGLAKLSATALHLCVVFLQVRRYNEMAKDAARESNIRMDVVDYPIKKVLICHASVGSGHKRAAEAVALAIEQLDISVEVRIVDLMEPPLADSTLIYFYKDWYLRLVGGETVFGKLGGHFIGFMFDRANNVEQDFTGGGFLTRRITQSFLLNFLELLYRMKPDVVVHTHFLAPQLLAALRRRHNFRVPHVTVVTDMDVHAWWYQQPTDHYFAPRELARHQLVLNGVPANDVSVSGIPIMPHFQETLSAIEALNRRQRRQRLLNTMDAHLSALLFEDDEDDCRRCRPLLVQMSTGRGTLCMYKNLLLLQCPVALVIVCGRQADVRRDLEQVDVPDRHRVSLLGYTRTMHELLAAADVIVTKPGGLITSEALACGLMIVVVDPYPGQEERNSSMLLEEGAGIWCWDYRDLQPKLDPVLMTEPHEKGSLQSYQRNALRLGRPEAAVTVARYVLSKEPRVRMQQDMATRKAVSEKSLWSGFSRPRRNLDGVRLPRPITEHDLELVEVDGSDDGSELLDDDSSESSEEDSRCVLHSARSSDSRRDLRNSEAT